MISQVAWVKRKDTSLLQSLYFLKNRFLFIDGFYETVVFLLNILEDRERESELFNHYLIIDSDRKPRE